jgi:hypothetical protein
LGDIESTAGFVQILQRDERADIGIDAVWHFCLAFFLDMTDAILAVGSILPVRVQARMEPTAGRPCQTCGH